MQNSDPTSSAHFSEQFQQLRADSLLRAKQLPPNTVQVWPGGATFPTISKALASITDAGPKNVYGVSVGPGTYVESIGLIPYVDVTGAGQDQTFVTTWGSATIGGAVSAMGNCGISNMSITRKAQSAADQYVFGVYAVTDDTYFFATNVTLYVNDSGYTTALSAISNAAGGQNFYCQFYMCTINVVGIGNSMVKAADFTNAGSMGNFIDTQITVDCPTGYGVMTSFTASATLKRCTVTAEKFALVNADQQSPITAYNCTLNGPVSQGVTINN